MESPNHKRNSVRWQDVYPASLALVLLVLSTLDPEAQWQPRLLKHAFLSGGLIIAAVVLFRLIRETAFCDPHGGRNYRKPLLAALVAIHLVATLFFFSPGDLLNNEPVVTLDHSFHHYQATRANHHFLSSGRLHFYDPFFMAGYPTAIFDLDMKAAELFCAFFPAGQVARALKLFIFLCYMTLIATVYLGARFLGYTDREALLALVLLLALWHWGRPYLSHFRFAGMYSFLLVSHGSVLVAGLMQRFWSRGSAVALFVLGPLLFFIHPTAVVILLVALVPLLILGRREASKAKLGIIILWCVTVIAGNLVWIVPMFKYLGDKLASQAYFQIWGVRELLWLVLRPGSLLVVVTMLLAAAGVFALSAKDRPRSTLVLPVAAIALLGIAAYGFKLPGIDQLEPGRFLVPAVIFLAPPAGAGLWKMLQWAWRTGAPGWMAPVALAAAMISPPVLSLLSAETRYHHRVTTSLSPEVRQLIEVLRQETTSQGRLMIEDGPAVLYDGVHLPGVLPLYTGVEQIGGPYPFTVIRQHFATFERERAMGLPLTQREPADLRRYFDLYNILWIVTASTEATDFVEKLAAAEGAIPARGTESGAVVQKIWHSRRYSLWRVARQPGYTDLPGISVTAGVDRIEIDTGGQTGPFVLKYHWDKGLSVTPPATLAPELRLDDPVPFIRVTPNGATTVVIRY